MYKQVPAFTPEEWVIRCKRHRKPQFPHHRASEWKWVILYLAFFHLRERQVLANLSPPPFSFPPSCKTPIISKTCSSSRSLAGNWGNVCYVNKDRNNATSKNPHYTLSKECKTSTNRCNVSSRHFPTCRGPSFCNQGETYRLPFTLAAAPTGSELSFPVSFFPSFMKWGGSESRDAILRYVTAACLWL